MLYHLENNGQKNICTYLVQTQFFFPNILDLLLVDSMNLEPTAKEGCLYSCSAFFGIL